MEFSNRKARRAAAAIAKGKGIDEATPRSIVDLPVELAGKRVLTTEQSHTFVGVSASEWDRMRARGETPPPVRRGLRALGYTVESLIQLIKARQQSAA